MSLNLRQLPILLAISTLLIHGCKPESNLNPAQTDPEEREKEALTAYLATIPEPAVSRVCFGYRFGSNSSFYWPAAPQKTRIRAVKLLRDNSDCGVPEWATTSLTYPRAVASDGGGRTYVSDRSGVLLFDESTLTMGAFANQAPNNVTYPLGMKVATGGNLYVVDGVKKSVLVYTPDNIFLREIGAGDFTAPVGVALDETNGWLYVSDKGSHKVRKYTLNGVFVSEIVSGGKGNPDELAFPLQLAVNSKGELLVLHIGRKVVLVYNSSGVFQFGFAPHYSEYSSPVHLVQPRGLAVDSEDNVYISDSLQSQLQVYTSTGKLRMVLGSTGNRPGQFSLPAMLDIDSNNRLFVAEHGNNRMQVFQLYP